MPQSEPESAHPTVFLGGPFKGLIDPVTGRLREADRARYTSLIDAFEERGWRVLSAHRTEDWGAGLVSDRECTRRDWEWMRECSVFVAFPGRPASPGTHVELGWASALGRPTVVLVEPDTECAALVAGLPGIAPVRLLEHTGDPAEVCRAVTEAAGTGAAGSDAARTGAPA
ncbi:nucleoside 2-deoxyribosyltransferase domain-containing protein [Streptomyces sp. XM4193]|uniref:nucleoside 2-deoxyribosyltransferase n=1 Tax=Streptomyces sp. XM4193 TaxID=2929782 RepID=UPI001FFA521C|nr:nucleoside 2-deoxyribosyltransferase [Streptomyces sp. XM4193]MCK1798991.1 nucleoside 2-deoxyribosyltransferase domain-containing protein [Streptomyces sp. XM4193]